VTPTAALSAARGHLVNFIDREGMAMVTVGLGRPVWSLLCACALLTLAGCGGLKLVPVSGKVTRPGQPLSGGAVSFVPDASKGNTARLSCMGRIGPDGRYELTTTGVTRSETGKGAPLGWYKVTLLTTLPGAADIKVDPRYTDPATTPLSKEVVANPEPGHYDLKLEQ
jgi:hypothetical protein